MAAIRRPIHICIKIQVWRFWWWVDRLAQNLELSIWVMTHELTRPNLTTNGLSYKKLDSHFHRLF